MLWACLAAGGAGALQKAGGAIKTETNAPILKQHLDASARKLKAWSQESFSKQTVILKLWKNG